MSNKTPITMEEVFDFIGVNYGVYARNASSFNIHCPECDSQNSRKRHLNVNLQKGRWRCPKCGSYGNAVNFYCFYKFGKFQMDKNEYTAMAQELEELIRNGRRFEGQTDVRRQKKSYQQIESSPIASDDVLDKAYRTLLRFDVFKLSASHKANLLKRGLDEETIVRNGYRTFPTAVPEKILKQERAYYAKNWAKLRSADPILQRTKEEHIMLGLAIGAYMQTHNIQIEGVPGFFKILDRWCFLITGSGIVIPTRNMEGKITSLQVRRDHGSVRYMTVSSKGLPLGVAENISRCHWPLENSSLTSGRLPEIILTEGPLKADVALHLARKSGNVNFPIAFVAIQGVNNTKSLFADCEILKQNGLKCITNALDMDRATNVNVMKGSQNLTRKFHELGMDVEHLLWDAEFAQKHIDTLEELCRKHDIAIPNRSDNVFLTVSRLSFLLHEAKVASKRIEWNPKSKGIDDYLKNYVIATKDKTT